MVQSMRHRSAEDVLLFVAPHLFRHGFPEDPHLIRAGQVEVS
jgi:hypothetical protein